MKFPVLTDTCGLPLEATVYDSAPAWTCWGRSWPRRARLLKLVRTAGAFQGQTRMEAFARHGVKVEVVRRSDGSSCITVHHHALIQHAESLIIWATITPLTRRTTRK
ncbi:hypothetical protein [Kitasatospora purpeofusca]|uniref:hypothetical protein n=1 Tax=Kitasatospora purpeofusca TaxID=67352 RepID=UPI003649372E